MNYRAVLIHFLTLLFLSIAGTSSCEAKPAPRAIPPPVHVKPEDTASAKKKPSDPEIKNPELPLIRPGDQIVRHTGYTLCYSETHEQAAWVAYDLTRSEAAGGYERTNKFIPDPSVQTGSATAADYANSGYDRGHLAPAGDMGWSAITMSESFYYSNMSPQEPSFNRGIWKKLEEQVRAWANADSVLYVVTGPVLSEGLPTIGPNMVSVPRYYYKVLLDFNKPGFKAIGFVLPNAPSSLPLSSFAVSVDSVERLTGLDFFPALPDGAEDLLESDCCVNCWTMGTGGSMITAPNSGASVQCKGTTQAGNRCRNMTRNENGYCHVHAAQAMTLMPGGAQEEAQPAASGATAQCKGITQAGNRCRNMTRNENGYCHVHAAQAGGSFNNAPSSAPSQLGPSVQCSGTTASGARCKRMTRNPSGRCYQH
ncbi:MAG: DNA/RNA non-specific endonuclease [Bacteroidetes bacterium]|nr:DNA/RNA non-specific endonuclease [Bacteroidota bacterium]